MRCKECGRYLVDEETYYTMSSVKLCIFCGGMVTNLPIHDGE